MSVDLANIDPPKRQASKRNSVQQNPIDAVIISNSLAAGNSSKEQSINSESLEVGLAKATKGILRNFLIY